MDLSHKLLTEEIKLDIKYGREMSRTRNSDDSMIQVETKKCFGKSFTVLMESKNNGQPEYS